VMCAGCGKFSDLSTYEYPDDLVYLMALLATGRR
jgi:hypothetical protein